MSEDLAAKYGRRSSSSQDSSSSNTTQSNNTNNSNIFKKVLSEKESQSINNSTNSFSFSKKTKVDKEQLAKEKEIKANIQDVLNRYSPQGETLTNTTYIPENNIIKKEESFVVKFLKAIIEILIVIVAVCIVVALIVKPEVDKEGEQIIEQIKKTENLYYSKMHKYHYFSKTTYDQTLGIDLSKYKYFSYYEVIPESENNNYEAKTYGATNAFTITYYVIKNWLANK